MKDNGVSSTHHHDSNGAHSTHQRHNSDDDPDVTLRNLHVDNFDIVTTFAAGNVNSYGFTDTDIKASAPPYTFDDSKLPSSTITTQGKGHDQVSIDSNFCNSSIHESQSSRKSLTNKR